MKLKLQEMKTRTYLLVGGMVVGVVISQFIRSLIYIGLVVIIVGCAFWFLISYNKWSEKVGRMFGKR